ncbi:MAG: hypothetical protein D3916_02275 [Candidatus Electrothrix sp. MAN1_4]|nr:hypothetical protein [Candidatus Electrothrix sp. MAN1_4]
MNTYLILAQSEISANALNRWFELFGEPALQPDDARRIIWQPSVVGSDSERGVISYENLVQRIETAIERNSPHSTDNIVVLVDTIRPSELNPLSEGESWNNLIALLILTFPEIKWLFGVMQNIPTEFQSVAEHHQLFSVLTRARRNPLFDPTGLREWVRKQAKSISPGHKMDYLAVREKTAASIEEESSYAYLHAYSAYRFGYRADVVNSWALMKERFGSEVTHHDYYLLLEDISLNFADRPDGIHILSLAERAGKLRSLNFYAYNQEYNENSKHRIAITAGQSVTHDTTFTKNKIYIESHKDRKGRLLFKPVGGILDLWQQAGLMKKAQGRDGNAPDFAWPPSPQNHNTKTTDREDAGHGTPGKLTKIAEILIRRAEKYHETAKLPEEFIKSAVLATDAGELLGGQTPTLTLSAVALRHELEVKAETAFVGVGYHFDVEKRIDEIKHEIRQTSNWFTKKVRKKALLDAQVFILNKISLILRQAGQFEEEQSCLIHLRRLHRKLQRPKLWEFFQCSKHLIFGYAEWLMASFGRFILFVLFWNVGLSILLSILRQNKGVTNFTDCFITAFTYYFSGDFTDCSPTLFSDYFSTVFENCFSTVFSSFFGVSLSSEPTYELTLSMIAVLAGVFHVGILISMLYSLISRK